MCSNKHLYSLTQKITKKSSQLKGEIYELIKHHYINFDSYVCTVVPLEEQLQEIMKDYKRLSNRIEQDLKVRVDHIAEERPKLEAKLLETQERITLVQSLVSVYRGIETAKRNLTPGKYVSCAECLHMACQGLESLGTAMGEPKVYSALKMELSDVVSDLSLKLREAWSKVVSWSPKSLPDSPQVSSFLSTELRVMCFSGDSSLDDIVEGMRLLTVTGIWTDRIRSFGRQLLERLIRPVIVHSNLCLISSKDSSTNQVLKINMSSTPQGGSIPELYGSLKMLFTVVCQILSEQYRQEWMSGIGEVVCVDMLELIIAHRLATAIPKDSAELEQYGKLLSPTKDFEGALVDMGLVVADKCTKLSKYTDDVSSHFAARKSQDLLTHARSILMRPLHDTVTVTQVRPLKKLTDLLSSSSGHNEGDSDHTTLSSHCELSDLSDLKFSFPTCVISESVQTFVDFLYSTLQEGFSSSSSALHIFSISRNMVDLFCAVLPSFHRQTIADIPQVAIVQHNNCMYLAHHLITLGHQFHSRLPPPLNSEITTFMDQVPLVRQLGEQAFLAEMKKHSSIILDFIKTCGGFDNVSEDVCSQSVRRGIQQALLHIIKLSQVYAEVLPGYLHIKSVGALLNVLTSEVVKSVLALEDIAMDDATELHSILSLVLERGYLVLSSTDEESQSKVLTKHCSSWSRLNSLAIVMDASLQKIVDLWDNGSGQLAVDFTPVQIRALIKALFKNTERRAAALNTISL